MSKKSKKIEMDMRVNRVARLLSNGAVRSEIMQYAAKEWEAAERTTDTYIAKARDLIRADWETDRLTFTAEILAQLATLQKEARNNLGAALGCIKTAAQIAQVLQ